MYFKAKKTGNFVTVTSNENNVVKFLDHNKSEKQMKVGLFNKMFEESTEQAMAVWKQATIDKENEKIAKRSSRAKDPEKAAARAGAASKRAAAKAAMEAKYEELKSIVTTDEYVLEGATEVHKMAVESNGVKLEYHSYVKPAHNGIARTYLFINDEKNKDYNNAIKEYKNAIKMDKNYAYAYYGWGETEIARGKLKEAKKVHKKLGNLDSNLAKKLEGKIRKAGFSLF